MVNRRSVLKAAGGVGIAGAASGLGVLTMSGGGAAAEISISATGPATVTNDRGDISQVTVNPQFDLQWDGLDDAVGKVFYLVEAKVGDGDYWPIFRATPWLTESQNDSYLRVEPGTSGRYRVKQPLSQTLNQDDRFDDSEGPDIEANPLVVADEQGRPNYEDVGGFPNDYVDFRQGNSVGNASDYPGTHEEDGYQNNYHDIDAGYYGAADDTSDIDNGADGSEESTPIQLRYTFELQRPNLSQLGTHPNIDGFDSDDAEVQKETAAENIDWVEVEDIDTGDSKIVMNGEDGNQGFSSPAGITYGTLQNNAENHVGILVNTASFDVTAENIESDSGVTGSSNTNAS